MLPWVQAIIGAIIWALANVVYYDLKSKGERGIGRFLAFWAGQPMTWFTFFFGLEGTPPKAVPPVDDEQALLREIQRDRAARARLEPHSED